MKHILIILFSLFGLFSCSSDTPSTLVSTDTREKPLILALGDSLTAGYGLAETDAYPAQLERKLSEQGYSYQVDNAGISGDTTAGLLSRLDWTLEGQNPTLAILCIGANDAFQGKSPEEIEANLRSIIEKLQAKKIPILFAGMKAPLNLGGEYGKKYEAIFPKLAKEYNLRYIDFFLEGVALKANLNQDDRIHPTREGYAIIVNTLMKTLEKEDLITK